MSSRRTRTERINRQSEDTGDAEDTVYLSGTGAYVYHEDSECPRVYEPDDKTRAEAQARWLAPCARCCLDGGEVT